ncbi:MAG TPA: FAD-dependent oxidoreductase [Actinomycetota bacterium]|nr:FAD-dependent oxidoreductase [Actinomycetota bacterium]
MRWPGSTARRQGEALPEGARRSYWLREALADDPGEACPPLADHRDADVLIVGGGYTGLWTAYFLTERAPGIDVVVLEQDICGGGPSGRNGGFVTAWWDELPGLVAHHGRDGALAACRAVASAVTAIGDWCGTHGVDAWYRRAGHLTTACSEAQRGSWARSVNMARDLGVPDEYVEVAADEVRRRCDSPVFLDGALMRDGATVQPARLARGLRRVLLERGVRIFEGSPVRRVRGGPMVEAETPGGRVRAARGVVAAGAWAAGWPWFERTLAVWTSYIVLSAPAPDLLERIGWTGGECITDERTTVQYFRTTPDGRVAFGGGGGRVASAKRIGRRFERDARSIERAAAGFRRLFPSFASVPIEDAWGGPIDVAPWHVPFYGTLPGGRLHHGFGYSGNGVAPSFVGGRILASLCLDLDDDDARLPMAHADPRPFPPEPIRTLGAHVVREAIVRTEQAEDEGRRPPALARFVARLPRRMGYELGPE